MMRIQCVKDIPQTPRITLDRAFNSSMESISCHEAVPGNKLFDGDLVQLDELRVHGSVENLEQSIVLVLTTTVVSPDNQVVVLPVWVQVRAC